VTEAKKKKDEGFDLLTIRTIDKANEGVEMEILHPADRTGTGMFLVVHGEDSEAHKRALGKIATRKEKQQRQTGKIRINHEDIEHGMLTTAMECTSDWRGVKEKGKTLEYNRANLRRVLAEYWFITEQVSAFLNDRANFMPDSQTSSVKQS
jgi:hypothetical protein